MAWTWANLLTAVRALSIAPLAWCMLEASGLQQARFCRGRRTDLLDGPVARKLDQVSAFGGVADHATDATFVSVASLTAAHLGHLPSPLGWLIAAAFIQYFFDSRVLRGRTRGQVRSAATTASPTLLRWGSS